MKNPHPWRIALVAYLGGLAFLAYWPSPVDAPIQGELADFLEYLHRHGVPRWLDYHVVEALANVCVFVPLGIFAAMAFPTRAWWHLMGLGAMVSTCMELGQLLFITARFSSLVDIVTNTLGAVIGIAAARLAAAKWPRRVPEPRNQ